MPDPEPDRLAQGWFLKRKKLIKGWRVDPFTLHVLHGKLVAHRIHKRMHVIHAKPYVLDRLVVSPLRSLTHEEFAAIVSSELAKELPDEYTVSRIRCFDIRFSHDHHEKLVTVIGRYNETVINTRNVMLACLDGPNLREAPLEHNSVERQGSTPQKSFMYANADVDGNVSGTALSLEETPAQVAQLPVIVSSRLTMTMDELLDAACQS